MNASHTVCSANCACRQPPTSPALPFPSLAPSPTSLLLAATAYLKIDLHHRTPIYSLSPGRGLQTSHVLSRASSGAAAGDAVIQGAHVQDQGPSPAGGGSQPDRCAIVANRAHRFRCISRAEQSALPSLHPLSRRTASCSLRLGVPLVNVCVCADDAVSRCSDRADEKDDSAGVQLDSANASSGRGMRR